MLNRGKLKVLFDMALNIAATALPIAVLQLIIYPQIAKLIGGEEYGLMLTIYSVWIMIPNSLGNVLNNIKLLRFKDYQNLGENGDIALLLYRWLSISTVIIFGVIWIYSGEFSLIHLLLGVLIAAVILLKAYLEVGFRIELNYIAILINNILLCAGYILGFILFRYTGFWEWVFLTGYLLSVLYCAAKTDLLREVPKKTTIYNEIHKDSVNLVFAAVINNLINYADKLVLYPLMGGTAVSVYYTATILGKIAGMLTGPINSVILSYISKWDRSRAGIFKQVLALGAVVVAICYVLAILLAKPVIGLLFPQWLDDVLEIIPLTTATVMLTILASLLQPFVLKYCDMKWQIVISAAGSSLYFMFALLLWTFIGLKGFCLGTIIGASSKLIIMILVYKKSTNSYNK